MPSMRCLAASFASRTLWMPFEQDRAVPVRADQRQLLPAQPRVLEHPGEGDARCDRVDVGRDLQAAPEHRVARVVGDAEVLQERRVPAVQVERPPAQQGGVQRDHEVRVARRTRASQEAHGQLVVLGPVELVPARSSAVGRGDLLHGVRALRRVDVRQAELGGGPGAGEVALGVGQLLDPDGREEHRGGHAGSEDGGGQVRRAPASPPRPDPPAPERPRVLARGVSIAGAGQDVGQRLGLEHLGGPVLELGEVLGDLARRRRADHPAVLGEGARSPPARRAHAADPTSARTPAHPGRADRQRGRPGGTIGRRGRS